MSHPTILCPVDFSEAGRGALRYAAAVAAHFEADMVVLTVNHPLLLEIVDGRSHAGQLASSSLVELRRFVADTFEGSQIPKGCSFAAAAGKPAHEILRVAREHACDLIVMSSRGRTGIRKLFFGTTTERVLRETSIPVLVTPPGSHVPADLSEVTQAVRHVLVPVDLSSGSARQVAIAAGIAGALEVPLLVTHVVEPLRYPAALEPTVPNINAELRDEADKALADLTASLPTAVKREALSLFGDPAEEIAKIARDRNAGLIVVGLHGSPFLGPRMGSVTYRILCLVPSLILAVPPAAGLRDVWRTTRAMTTA